MKNLITQIRKLIPLLPAGTSRFLMAYMVSTSALNLLDTFALGLLAVILNPMVTGSTTHLPFVGTIGPDQYPWVLLVISSAMILKAILALVIQWYATRRFSVYELAVGDKLFAAYIRSSWTDRLSRSTAELVRMADVGIANTISGVLFPAISLPQQIASFLAVVIVLIIAQPGTAIITLLYFGMVGAFMYLGLSHASVTAGQVNLRYSLRVARLMTEMVAALKEITLRNQFDDVAAVVHANRERSTRARANIQFLGAVPQRLIEGALVGGFVVVGAYAWIVGGPTEAFAAIALFGLAGFRITPSLVTFQSVMTSTANNLPHLQAVLDDIEAAERYLANADTIGKEPLKDTPRTLHLDKVSFTYPGAPDPAVNNLSLTIPMGSSVGIVGASGSGKSTLVDILLGLLTPQEGQILLDGQSLTDVLADWRSRVGYVPQEVALFDASIAQNIALTWGEDIDEERVQACLERAQLAAMVAERPGGIHARIGERGLALSGGERQRLGIARALYVNPLILVMDEATSALDTKTEDSVTRAIRDLHGQVTVISVAHRLSTIRDNDQICFMRASRLEGVGTFNELVATQPDFAAQARLAGLAE
ncbi:MAG: ABC transporter ATP-binding protein [Actinomycetaceae bacterium]|nr:ABC transporter ATP-binding protein [Actinomycetaceae bacterium]